VLFPSIGVEEAKMKVAVCDESELVETFIVFAEDYPKNYGLSV